MADKTTPTRGVVDQAPTSNGGVSRRSFIQTLGLSAAAGALATDEAQAALPRSKPSLPILGPDPIEVQLKINGQPERVTIEPSATLLETLRLTMNLTGTKEICDRGSCGGCSVLVDGKVVSSCMMLAVDAIGSEITTVEGLANGERLDPIQESFIRHDALQCGYCTPGLIMASRALLQENPKPTLEQIKKGLAGNLCRCGTYTNVFNAVLEASGQSPVQDLGG